MQMQMYSRNPFDEGLRITFTLYGDPYHKLADKARKQLVDLGVVFYRDEHHPEGIILDESALELRGWQAYKHAAVVQDFDSARGADVVLQVQPWPKPTQEYITKHGDDKAWLHFNKEVRIAYMNTDLVQLT